MNVPDDRARRKALRLELVGRRLAMDPATLAPLHAALSERLEVLLTRLAPRSIGFTWPYRGEFDALPLMRRWLTADPARWAALPVVGEKGQPMTFRRWAPETAMATDRYGIPYPAEGEPVVPELLLIPCNGFDARGYRLGYGAGHYDRTLAALEPTPLAVGMAIEDGRLDDLQPQPHDLPMDWIVTEAGAFPSRR
ncbi:5-formyltetrahydrofolate cyclo-ligase [Methyloversatilis sp.]|uniref:5-formyltetrahydrofolate cyclo-ligase n=1 Tax=Methyloversatilis sp. TaxID=2569862 RepID=UPI003D2A0419